jgi:flagellar hook-basal body complex protein FliE
MSIEALRGMQAYAAAAARAAQPAAAPGGTARADFGALVQSAIADLSGSLQAGEAAAAQVAAGEASLVDVVTAISAAEVSLETALAVRNRVIEAYQEIMRMPI